MGRFRHINDIKPDIKPKRGKEQKKNKKAGGGDDDANTSNNASENASYKADDKTYLNLPSNTFTKTVLPFIMDKIVKHYINNYKDKDDWFANYKEYKFDRIQAEVNKNGYRIDNVQPKTPVLILSSINDIIFNNDKNNEIKVSLESVEDNSSKMQEILNVPFSNTNNLTLTYATKIKNELIKIIETEYPLTYINKNTKKYINDDFLNDIYALYISYLFCNLKIYQIYFLFKPPPPDRSYSKRIDDEIYEKIFNVLNDIYIKLFSEKILDKDTLKKEDFKFDTDAIKNFIISNKIYEQAERDELFNNQPLLDKIFHEISNYLFYTSLKTIYSTNLYEKLGIQQKFDFNFGENNIFINCISRLDNEFKSEKIVNNFSEILANKSLYKNGNSTPLTDSQKKIIKDASMVIYDKYIHVNNYIGEFQDRFARNLNEPQQTVYNNSFSQSIINISINFLKRSKNTGLLVRKYIILTLQGIARIPAVPTGAALLLASGITTGLLYAIFGEKTVENLSRGAYTMTINTINKVIVKSERITANIYDQVKKAIREALKKSYQFIVNGINSALQPVKYLNNLIERMIKFSELQIIVKEYNKNTKNLITTHRFTDIERRDFFLKIIHKLVFISCNSFTFYIPPTVSNDSPRLSKYKEMYKAIFQLKIKIDNMSDKLKIGNQLNINELTNLKNESEEGIKNIDEMLGKIIKFKNDYAIYLNSKTDDSEFDLYSKRLKEIDENDNIKITDYNKKIDELNIGEYKNYSALLKQILENVTMKIQIHEAEKAAKEAEIKRAEEEERTKREHELSIQTKIAEKAQAEAQRAQEERLKAEAEAARLAAATKKQNVANVARTTAMTPVTKNATSNAEESEKKTNDVIQTAAMINNMDSENYYLKDFYDSLKKLNDAFSNYIENIKKLDYNNNNLEQKKKLQNEFFTNNNLLEKLNIKNTLIDVNNLKKINKYLVYKIFNSIQFESIKENRETNYLFDIIFLFLNKFKYKKNDFNHIFNKLVLTQQQNKDKPDIEKFSNIENIFNEIKNIINNENFEQNEFKDIRDFLNTNVFSIDEIVKEDLNGYKEDTANKHDEGPTIEVISDIDGDKNFIKGGYILSKYYIENDDLMVRLLGYIFNMIEEYDKPEMRTFLQKEYISDLLKKFISTDGLSPDILTMKKLDTINNEITDKPLKVKIPNAKLLSCYIDAIAIFIYHYITDRDVPKIIEMVEPKIVKTYDNEALKKLVANLKTSQEFAKKTIQIKLPDNHDLIKLYSDYTNANDSNISNVIKPNLDKAVKKYIQPFNDALNEYLTAIKTANTNIGNEFKMVYDRRAHVNDEVKTTGERYYAVLNTYKEEVDKPHDTKTKDALLYAQKEIDKIVKNNQKFIGSIEKPEENKTT
jgi:hypothetical protein